MSTMPPSFFIAYAQENTWTTLAPMPTPRTGLGVAVANGKIYAISKSATEEYDPETNTWTSKTPMPTARSDFGIATYKNKIYVIGGESGYAPDSNNRILTGANEVYDPSADTWSTKKAMPTPRFYIEANTVNNKIYLIAGSTNSENPNVNEAYFPETDTWTTKAPIPNPTYGYASAVLDDKIYLFGGGPTPSNLNQIYDAKIDSWSLGMSLPSMTRTISAGATTGDFAPKRIYVLGGSEGFAVPLNLNRIYDPLADEWSVGTPMLTSRYAVSIAVLDDFVYAIGGGSGLSGIKANELYIPAGHTLADTILTPTPPPTIQPTSTPTASPEPTDVEFPVFMVASIIVLVVGSIGVLTYIVRTKRRT